MSQEELENNDTELNLIDLVSIIVQRKWVIIGFTLIAMIIAILYSVFSLVLPPQNSFLPNEFTPQALMLINDDSSSGGGLSSILNSSGLGSIASLAGVSSSSASTNSSLAVYLTSTNSFLDAISNKFMIKDRYKIKSAGNAECRDILKKKIIAKVDKESGVFSISYTDIDPVFAQSVTNYCVEYLEKRFDEMGIDKNKVQKQNLEVNITATYNEILKLVGESRSLESSVSSGNIENRVSSIMLDADRIKLELEAKENVYTQLKTKYELLKISMASESPVFQVLEYAEVPDKKSRPSRMALCLIVTLSAFFGAIIFVFIMDAIENVKKDPLAMAKLSKRK